MYELLNRDLSACSVADFCCFVEIKTRLSDIVVICNYRGFRTVHNAFVCTVSIVIVISFKIKEENQRNKVDTRRLYQLKPDSSRLRFN